MANSVYLSSGLFYKFVERNDQTTADLYSLCFEPAGLKDTIDLLQLGDEPDETSFFGWVQTVNENSQRKSVQLLSSIR